MSSQPPKKSWADMVKSGLEGSPRPKAVMASSSPIRSSATPKKSQELPPQPQRLPQPAPPLPPIDSKSAVQPCFDTIKNRGYPLGFESKAQFEECMQELMSTAEAQGIICKGAGVRGSAVTFTSSNPFKVGQSFDSRGQGKSDIDAFLVSDEWLKCRPNGKGFFHPDKVAEKYPNLVAWGEKWSEKLGREITPAIFRSDAPAFDEPYIPF